ncbi:hypothetical protein EUTSA_v10015150mg [Eutrema salsugineum]|uniref:Uncharacterized protein n=1 Tax=Eutrema salsugineum TaxID=72664 RepID=V4LBK6_EUTSA|nr:hypothetical protein EUTSA_v10015150mg [Eutrema salsugineum]
MIFQVKFDPLFKKAFRMSFIPGASLSSYGIILAYATANKYTLLYKEKRNWMRGTRQKKAEHFERFSETGTGFICWMKRQLVVIFTE